MAKTFVLGGSPLGLIGTLSRPDSNNRTTFNGGDSRNINVNSYNRGKKQETNIKIGESNVRDNVSLFTGNSIPNFWGNISKMGTDEGTTGSDNNYNGINRKTLHNDEVYDTSILNIIEKLSFSTKAALRMQDFAYLKNIGVYPNNRLMIARRFSSPQKDNIMDKGGMSPLSVLIAWKPEGEDFLDFSFGEEWGNSPADFTGLLNDMGKNFSGSAGSKMGDKLSAGLDIMPMSGFTEIFQRKILKKLGVYGETSDEYPLPSGNPNLIKEAKIRKLVPSGDPGSGLKADFTIKMKVEYEQKFISGIDPTVAWMDILSNALSFGTSNSDTYGLSPKFGNNIKKWSGKNGISLLIKEVIRSIRESLTEIKESVTNLIMGSIEKLNNAGDSLKGFGKGDGNELFEVISTTISNILSKYRIKISGIVSALSGLPSTPWHVTVGNPLRPIFCSGDMLVENVEVKMGSTLAFNDLPSRMTIEFTLKNARNLGMQEIMAKFNTGYLRTVNTRRTYLTEDYNSESNNDGYYRSVGSDNNNESNTGSPTKSIGDNSKKSSTKENG